ncbi:helix-turn-helix domain-containing protein [uncultured Mitsuokella sp.]|uniref:helix-turn-helix domain-containing protein n=1 Tax=uncultured Mitsuokella sp. TaxID=453120 RepID=UPI0025939354|nr:helix-turn-helix domain-containing protein [uncultured Mitsuokella sp.]
MSDDKKGVEPVGSSDKFQEGVLFDKFPRAISKDRQLSAGAKLTFLAIYAVRTSWGRVDPSRQELAERTGQSVRTIQRGLNELEAAGWIQKRRYKNKRGTLRTSFIIAKKKLLANQQ